MIIALTAAMLVLAGQQAATTNVDLEGFKWEKRVLLLCAEDGGDPRFSGLKIEILDRKPEVEDRDLVVFEILETGPSTMNGSPIDPRAATALRERFKVSRAAFAVILLGKDGGTKLNRNGPVTLDEIFGLIDSMPMRREEMRRKEKP